MTSPAELEEIVSRSKEIGKAAFKEGERSPDIAINAMGRAIGSLAAVLDRMGVMKADDVIALLTRRASQRVEDVNDAIRSRGEA
jgi:hypothetical protein